MLKHELIQNKKSLLLTVLSIWGIAAIIGAFFGYNAPYAKGIEMGLYAFVAMLAACIVASASFSDLKTKEGRINNLMLPASQFSKFAVRWLAVVPALFIVLVIGFYVCELSRILFFLMSSDAEYISANPWLSRVTNPSELSIFSGLEPYKMFVLVTTFVCSYLFSQSLYLLGAVLWPRLSFIKTLVATWAIQTVLSILFTLIFRFYNPFHAIISSSGEAILWTAISVMFLLTLVAYALAYYRYTRTQVVYKLF